MSTVFSTTLTSPTVSPVVGGENNIAVGVAVPLIMIAITVAVCVALGIAITVRRSRSLLSNQLASTSPQCYSEFIVINSL